MGAGQYNAGASPTTGSPTVLGSAVARTLPTALWFDGKTKTYLLDETTGQYKSIHPVDQRVALKLLVKYGTIKASPKMGNRFHLIQLDGRAESSARAEVLRILADEIARGDIRIASVTVQVNTGVASGLGIQVDYYNLRTLPPSRQTATNVNPTG